MLVFTAVPATGFAEVTIHNNQTEDVKETGKTLQDETDSKEEGQAEDNADQTDGNENESVKEEQIDDNVNEDEKDKNDETVDETESIEPLANEVEESDVEEEPEGEEKEVEEVEEVENFALKVMHLNDTHSHADKLPKAITEVKNQRAENDNNLLLHAGDSFSGTLYFNLFNGLADLDMFNLMGIDGFAFGNHEFDLGTPEGHPELSDFIEKANFPFLGANADFSADPTLSHLKDSSSVVENPKGGKAYNAIIKDVNGESVGIFGLTTEDTKDIASPELVKFSNYKQAAEDAVAALESEGVNKIIAVTHIGYDSNPAVGNDLLLAELVPEIDIIVGGHSHTKLSETIEKGPKEDPTLIVQTGQYVDNLGVLDVEFDEEGRIVKHNGKLIDLSDVTPDAEAEQKLAEKKLEVDALFDEDSGAEALKELTNPRHEGDDKSDSVRANETELGNLVTDAMLAKAQEKFSETVIALQNGGGIRAPIAKGPITNGEIINVLPFGNDPVIATITGAELKEILEHGVNQAPNESGGFLHVSGMKYYFDSNKDIGDRVIRMQVLEDGKYIEIENDKEYMVTTNQFTAQGGDGFETFAKIYADGRVTNIGELDWEQLRDYMTEAEYLGGEVDPVREGRILDAAIDEIPEEVDPTNPEPTDPEPEDPKPIPDPEDPKQEPEDSGDGKDSGDEDKGTVLTPEKNDKGKGGILPSTATTMYTTLLIGALLLLAGIIVFVIRKRRMN